MTKDIEFVAADPARRRAFLIVLLVVFAVFVLLYGLIGDPFEWLSARLLAAVDAAGETGPAAAQELAGRIVLGMVFSAWLACAAMVGYYVLMGMRMWRAEQWPLPGARLLVDMRVVRGKALRRRALVVIVLPLLALLPLSYYSLRVALWAATGISTQ